MKKFLISLAFFTLLLSGCNVITSSSANPSAQPPVEHGITAQPTETNSEISPETETSEPLSRMIVYVGLDDNLWQVNTVTGEKTQFTNDAAGFSADNSTVVVGYQSPAWSSDGRYLAFQRYTATPMSSGYSYAYNLMIYDAESKETRALLQNIQTTGFAWKPGTHLLSFGRDIPPEYWTARGSVDAALASGIWGIDADTNATSELVKPEAGYSLVNPVWAPNGEVLSFEEAIYMEGRGPLAYYDFSAGKYVRWEESIGAVSWAPDGSQLLHDNLNYSPSYDERIFLVNRDHSGEKQLSPDVKDSYAYNPVFSPDGSQVAYLFVQGQEGNSKTSVMLLNLSGGDPRELASYNQVYNLSWSPDGQSLLFSGGNYPDTKIILLSIAKGTVIELGDGWQPAIQP